MTVSGLQQQQRIPSSNDIYLSASAPPKQTDKSVFAKFFGRKERAEKVDKDKETKEERAARKAKKAARKAKKAASAAADAATADVPSSVTVEATSSSTVRVRSLSPILHTV
jgi:hypothetical protein